MFDIENIKDAIKTAIQMEKDGYSFYKKAAAQTNSDMGKTIFEGLAADEQMHLGVFEKMFEEIKIREDILGEKFSKNIRTLLSKFFIKNNTNT